MEELVRDVRRHLELVNTEPATSLDTRLIDDLRRKSETAEISTDDQLEIINSIVSVISKIQQDPTSLTDLVKTFLDGQNPPSFVQIMSQEPEVDLVAGLRAPSEPINLLCLRLLRAACRRVADVGLVASKPDVVLALVDVWLTTTRTAVATQSESALADLLGAESPVEEDGDAGSVETFPTHEPVVPGSMGLMWRRVFKDKDIYRSMFSHCSLKTLGQPGQMSKANKTNAQARLFGLLQSIFYAPQIWESQNAGVEQEFDVPAGAGILDFALSKMVDWEDDVLMHSILVQFYQDFIRYTGPHVGFSHRKVPPLDKKPYSSLEKMISLKLHDRTMSYYLKPDPQDPLSDYLYGPAVRYIGDYAAFHTEHFRSNAAKAVLRKLSDTLGNIRPSEWANDRLPNFDLGLLPAIPRRICLDLDPSGGIISNIVIKPINLRAPIILQLIFSRPPKSQAPVASSEDEAARASAERMAARALFSLYLNQHPTFWKDLTAAADVRLGNFSAARAALTFLQHVIDSQWERLPTESPSEAPFIGLPTESQLRERCSNLTHSLPLSGAVLMVTEPAIGIVLPWLVEPPPRLPPSAAPGSGERDQGWELARLKHEVLRTLRQRLAEIGQGGGSAGGGGGAGGGEEAMDVDAPPPPQAWRDVLELLERRDRMGPWGDRGAQSVRVPEPEVATMEM